MMIDALTYLREQVHKYNGRAAILGKGPSFGEFDGAGRHTGRFVVGLNETALYTRCDASFIIDEDILERSSRELADSGIEALITPRVPHRKATRVGGLVIYGPGNRDALQAPWKEAFGARLRLFNLATAEAQASLGPTIPAYNFSAPTLANLLAQAGFKDVLLAGVDGGTAYAQSFKSVEYKKLRSVQNDFNTQFRELRQVRDLHGVSFSSARCSEAHVLIGAEVEQCLATEVLKWSIDTNTFLTVKYCEADSASRSMYASGEAGTPFSFQRIFLPEMAHHAGRGVYFDSDMLVFKDVYDLFNADMGGNVLLSCAATPGRRPQFSVFLVDNERAAWEGASLVDRYRDGAVTYDALMKEFSFAEPKAATLPMAWNSLECFERGQTANIHFTDMGTQPWLSVYNPNADLWCEALLAALDQRPAVRAAYERSLSQGWVRPSLQWQVEHRRPDPWSMPTNAKALDAAWLPPHVRLRFPKTVPRTQLLKWRVASRIRRLLQSRTYVRLAKAGHALRKVVATSK